ncbi:aldo/keto reductase [Phenylobacterium sp.]|uniref:aldo/keto reductase n=1 Tax=Phenylobacterium sp. TaxID=1871053 RepID=UPI003BA86E35
MTDQTFLTLNDGRRMPQVGLGVWQSPAETTADTVATALAAGYLAIDTAAAYRNEPGVGEGVKRSGVARDKLFITTKLWNENQGHDAALAAFDKSLARLGMDYVDLYLIHWPAPTQNLYLESWKALIRLREEGRAKSIGVSNFAIPHLERIIGETGVTPAANQIELHPRWQQAQLRAFHAAKGIATTSWSPLGQGRLLDDPVIGQIAAKHGKTAAQVIIRWHVDLGLTVIPKSVTPARIVANLQVFDFALDAEDLKAIAGLDAADGRIGPDPAKFG